MTPKVKICCIGSIEEAKTAIGFGASALGLVGKMPSGPGVIDDKLINNIARTTPPPISTFLLTSERTSEKIIVHHRATNTNTIQFVDSVDEKTYKILRESLPAIKLVQVIHVIDEASTEEAIKASSFVDALLLDSGNPNLKIKELGGTGRTHDWELSKKIKESVETPVFLAGGLNHRNVRRAIEEVEPFGVDLCSGVRTNGKLDIEKLEAFVNAVFSAS